MQQTFRHATIEHACVCQHLNSEKNGNPVQRWLDGLAMSMDIPFGTFLINVAGCAAVCLIYINVMQHMLGAVVDGSGTCWATASGMVFISISIILGFLTTMPGGTQHRRLQLLPASQPHGCLRLLAVQMVA